MDREERNYKKNDGCWNCVHVVEIFNGEYINCMYQGSTEPVHEMYICDKWEVDKTL